MKNKKKRKGSAVDVMLVPIDRRAQRRVRFYLLVLFLLLPGLAFFAGDFHARNARIQEIERSDVLTKEVQRLSEALTTAQEQLALQRTDSEVTQQAQENVRGQIKELRDQVAELEEAVAFYKNVMAPGSGEMGLRIEKLDIAATTTPRQYNFRLVLTQVGDNRGALRGSVTLTLAGRNGVEAVKLKGSELLAQGADTRFQFRYFQELTGRMILPEGVEAEQVTIEAISTGRRAAKVEKNFIWRVQESSSAWAR